MVDCLPERRPQTVEAVIEEYLDLGRKMRNPPKVALSLYSQTPSGEEDVGALDIAVTTAVQCYAPGNAKLRERDDARSHQIAKSTRVAGHLTTRQHAHYTFHLEGVSRSVVHEVLHDYPFYNSEQQSQRYVEVAKGSYIIPEGLSPEQEGIYLEAANYANRAYFELLEMLQPEVDRRMHEMYPEKGWNSDRTKARLESKTNKISQEVARYVLPISQKTTLYHTLSQLSIQRLFYASRMEHVSDEARYVIGSMIKAISEIDDSFLIDLTMPLEPVENAKLETSVVSGNSEEFDSLLNGGMSVLLDAPQNIRTTIPFALRNTLGKSPDELSDEDAWDMLLNPSKNPNLADVYDIGILDSLTQNLHHAIFVFATKMSHAAHSQSQRHRTTPSTQPDIANIYNSRADYETPMIIRENPELKTRYDTIMAVIYQNVERAINAGIPREIALGLLPNAQTVRVVECGDLFYWHHRWKQRLCMLAQEEIFFVSLAQANKAGDLIPAARQAMLAPCGIRQAANIRPRCPEGDRWCGQPVYNWDIGEYTSKRLV